jgi:pSer/pThr/pTyr-binding forkhead associated (FHA) protein
MTEKNPKLVLIPFELADLQRGKHILIVESSESKRAVTLNVNIFSIGRHPNSSLVLNDILVSRHHATITWLRYSENDREQDCGYWIIDGKGKKQRSRNGVFVNGTQKSLHRLVSGDVINLGTDIKMTYNYIPNTTENRDFLKYCDSAKPQYSSSNTTNYKDTTIFVKDS